MTAAYRLKGLGWFGGVVMVSLGFYLVSLQVAAERKRLAQVDAQIHSAARDIRALETEFDVRANLTQLERWNGDTLALVAPSAAQFVRSDAQLASISFAPGTPATGDSGVRTAALIVPSRPADMPSVPIAIEEAPPAAAAPPRVATLVQVAAKQGNEPAAKPAPIRAVALIAPGTSPATALRKARTVAMLDKSLLSDTTLGDLLSGARAERGRLR